MTQTNRTPDALDELLSEFYQAQMHHPWPPAPVHAAARSSPASGSADPGRRARMTLAASVALVLGTCWYLASGSPVGGGAAKPAGGFGPNVLQDGSAKTPEAFHKDRTDEGKKTTDPMVGFEPGKFKLP